MDREDLLRQMIAEKRQKIELYQMMIAEYEQELSGNVSAPITPVAPAGGNEMASGGEPLAVVKEFEFHNKHQTAAARIVLERVGYPLSTQQILEAIVRGGVTVGGKTPQLQKTYLYTILHRSKKNFGLAAKDRWGLRGWKGIPKWDGKDDNGSEKEVTTEKEKEADAK
jgi:hypothetical protein